jgi:hypothetical protein
LKALVYRRGFPKRNTLILRERKTGNGAGNALLLDGWGPFVFLGGTGELSMANSVHSHLSQPALMSEPVREQNANARRRAFPAAQRHRL